MADDKDLQKKIDTAVEEATAALKAKTDELLTELKAERKAKTVAAEKLAELEAAKTAAETEAAEEKAKKTGDFAAQKKLLEDKHKLELDKATAATAAAKTQLNQLLVDEGLTRAMVAAKVAPQLQEAAIALIKAKHKTEVVDVDGKPIAQIDGKAISEFIPAWSQGDSGKSFVAAPDNGGGGSGGANGQGGAKTGKSISRPEFNKLSPAEQMSHVKDGGKVTDAA